MLETNTRISQSFLWNVAVPGYHAKFWPCFALPPFVNMYLTLALCLQVMIHTEHTSETFIFIALFWENYSIWQSFLLSGHLTNHKEPDQMGGGNELHHHIVQCLKNLGLRVLQVLSCALLRVRGRCSVQAVAIRSLCSWLGSPSQLSPKQNSQPGKTSPLWNQRSCAREGRHFPTQQKNKPWKAS